MVEQIGTHKVGIALVVILAQTHIFVQIDGLDPGEVHLTVFIFLDEHLIGANGAAAGGQTQNTVGLQCYNGSDDITGLPADIGVVLCADDSHS